MKKIFTMSRLFSLFLLLICFLKGLFLVNISLGSNFAVTKCTLPDKDEAASSITVKVVNLRPLKGTLRLALYGSRKAYEDRSNAVCSTSLAVRSGNATIGFTGLSEGWYAIMFYHDTNNNGKFDRILGIPKEQFGFSNNALPGLGGPPSFDKTKFFVPKGKNLIMVLKAQ